MNIKNKVQIFRLWKSNNVPLRLIIQYCLVEKIIYRIFGLLKVRQRGGFYVAPSSKIKMPSHIHLNRGRLRIGPDCNIDAFSRNGIIINGKVDFGYKTTVLCTSDYANIGKGLVVNSGTSLGSNSFYGCGGGIVIGENVLVGNYVSFHSENHVFSAEIPIQKQGVTRKGIIIGNDCWIGAKATILDGANIGDGCVVAAGAVVRGNFPPYSVIAGVPAKIIKSRLYDKDLKEKE